MPPSRGALAPADEGALTVAGDSRAGLSSWSVLSSRDISNFSQKYLVWKLKRPLKLCNPFPFLSGLIFKITKLRPRQFRDWSKATASSLRADLGQEAGPFLPVHVLHIFLAGSNRISFGTPKQ